jgi:L,D-transpeptidase ErfK/SrfK
LPTLTIEVGLETLLILMAKGTISMNIHNRFMQFAGLLISILMTSTATAKTFTLPPPSESLIGNMTYATTQRISPAPIMAQYYYIGQNTLVSANTGIIENGPVPAGLITVPTQFLLPPLARKGVVINLPEMRMYYYVPGSNTVMTFPVGIGKIGKTIPIRNATIIRKKVNPTWTPPADIREFDRDQGIDLPPGPMAPGPDNPLGPYAIYLSIPTYLIHSTIYPESIGRRASFGCIRMNEDDIKPFFTAVTPGTPVTIVNMPIKVAWQDNMLYLESHPALEEHGNGGVSPAVSYVENAIPRNQVVFVNWQLVAYLAQKPDGVPHEIGVRIN